MNIDFLIDQMTQFPSHFWCERFFNGPSGDCYDFVAVPPLELNQVYTLWLFNIAMENGPFIDGLPMNMWFSMAMFNRLYRLTSFT